jgi:hypothetical protein
MCVWASAFLLLCLRTTAYAAEEAVATEKSEPTSAVLFLSCALAFGIFFRRALAGRVLPYTAVLLVRFLHIDSYHSLFMMSFLAREVKDKLEQRQRSPYIVGSGACM